MANLSDDQIRKRLKSLNCSQESVQTMAEWVLRYKDSHIDRIAQSWMNLYKEESDDQQKTALIYMMNDVVQKATKKGTTNAVTVAFHPHVINAIGISSTSVKTVISRCIEIFDQRKVFPSHIIEEMRAALVSQISAERDKEDLSEIDSLMLIRQIEGFYQNETLTDKAREILSKTAFNFKATMEGSVKDRTEGKKLLQEMDSAKKKLDTFLTSVERHRNKGVKLISVLNQLKGTFNHQLKDVILVNDAYEKFANGIRSTKTKLQDMIDTSKFPGREMSSLLINAPSPTPNDDPFAEGFGGEPGTNGGEDMEMDEEDVPGSSKASSLIPASKYMPIPSIPTVDPRLQKLLNNTQGPSPGHPNMAMMDPRQSRMFPPPPHLMQNMPPRPPLIPSLDSIPTPKYPHPSQMQNVSQPSPPGIQPPPPGTTTTTMNNTGSKPSSLNLDTSLPPPFFNRIDGHDSTPVSPVLYHPTNPPHLPPAFFPPLMNRPCNPNNMRPPLPPTSSPNIHGQYSPMPLNRLPGPGRHSFDGERSSRKSNGGGDYDYGGGEYMHNSGPPKRRNSNSGSGHGYVPNKRGNWRGSNDRGRGHWNNNSFGDRGGYQRR